jgi:hypothetical protein
VNPTTKDRITFTVIAYGNQGPGIGKIYTIDLFQMYNTIAAMIKDRGINRIAAFACPL